MVPLSTVTDCALLDPLIEAPLVFPLNDQE
jgi:hypothetical protein